MSDPIVCTPKSLPRDKWVDAARKALEINPANQPPTAVIARGLGGPGSQLERIAVMVAKRWHTAGVHLTVGFLDNPPADLRARIIAHMNAWAKTANVQFTETKTDPQVRIARASSPPALAPPQRASYASSLPRCPESFRARTRMKARNLQEIP